LNVIFSAIAQLKAEVDKLNTRIMETRIFPKFENTFVEEFKVIPIKKATLMIKDYVSKNPGCLTSQIISDLHLDPDLVLKILRKLRKSGELRSEDIA